MRGGVATAATAWIVVVSVFIGLAIGCSSFSLRRHALPRRRLLREAAAGSAAWQPKLAPAVLRRAAVRHSTIARALLGRRALPAPGTIKQEGFALYVGAAGGAALVGRLACERVVDEPPAHSH